MNSVSFCVPQVALNNNLDHREISNYHDYHNRPPYKKIGIERNAYFNSKFKNSLPPQSKIQQTHKQYLN